MFYYLMQAMRVDPLDFQWLEKPDDAALEAATEELNLLGALDHRQNLTPLGHLIGDLQVDPGIAHMIYYACSKGLGTSNTERGFYLLGLNKLFFVFRKSSYHLSRPVFRYKYGFLAWRR